MDVQTSARVRAAASARGERFTDESLTDDLRALAREVAWEYRVERKNHGTLYPTPWVETACDAVFRGRETDGYLRGLLNFAAGSRDNDAESIAAPTQTPNPAPTLADRAGALTFEGAREALTNAGIPDGRYAVPSMTGNGDLRFYRIRTRYGRTYFDRVVGSGYGGFNRAGMLNPERGYAVASIIADTLGSAQRFAREVGRCSRCLSPLTDDLSRERGLGPDCERHYGLTR